MSGGQELYDHRGVLPGTYQLIDHDQLGYDGYLALLAHICALLSPCCVVEHNIVGIHSRPGLVLPASVIVWLSDSLQECADHHML